MNIDGISEHSHVYITKIIAFNVQSADIILYHVRRPM